VSKEWRNTSPKLKKFLTQPSAWKVMLTPFWDERGVILEHYMPHAHCDQCKVYRSKESCVLQQGPNDVDVWMQVFCCNMTMLGPILPVQLSQQTNICQSVFHTRRTRHTSAPVISCLWTAQTGDGRKVFQIRRRGPAGVARVATLLIP
jgi:hypothetical protein